MLSLSITEQTEMNTQGRSITVNYRTRLKSPVLIVLLRHAATEEALWTQSVPLEVGGGKVILILSFDDIAEQLESLPNVRDSLTVVAYVAPRSNPVHAARVSGVVEAITMEAVSTTTPAFTFTPQSTSRSSAAAFETSASQQQLTTSMTPPALDVISISSSSWTMKEHNTSLYVEVFYSTTKMGVIKAEIFSDGQILDSIASPVMINTNGATTMLLAPEHAALTAGTVISMQVVLGIFNDR